MSTGTGVSTIPEAIARMEAIDAALPRKDGVAIFNRLYLQVRDAYLDGLARTTELAARAMLV